jgi:hypothetical protein
MSVRGGFIGEFCAAIIAFVFPATTPRMPGAAAAAFATAAAVVTSIIATTIHIACHY